MSVGISDWAAMEQAELHDETRERELSFGELAVDAHGHRYEVLAYHDDETFAVHDGDDIVTVPMSLLYPAPHGAFTVTTADGTDGVTVRHFATYRAAQNFAGNTDEDVLAFDGLMA